MQKLLDTLEHINTRLGQIGAWSALLLVGVIMVDVLLRYVFNFTKVWVIELETYLFALLLMLGGAYAFSADQHVRVDVFYAKWSERRKAWVNLIGGILLLLPWCVVVLKYGSDYALTSFQQRETSSQPGGLPALYLLKGLLAFGFLLLLLQALVSIGRSLIVLSQKSSI